MNIVAPTVGDQYLRSLGSWPVNSLLLLQRGIQHQQHHNNRQTHLHHFRSGQGLAWPLPPGMCRLNRTRPGPKCPLAQPGLFLPVNRCPCSCTCKPSRYSRPACRAAGYNRNGDAEAVCRTQCKALAKHLPTGLVCKRLSIACGTAHSSMTP